MSVEAMIAKMESFLGTVGRPNEATNWYAARNGSYFARAAWCNMTITWAAHQTGNYDAVCFGKDYAYTVWHAQRFQQAGQWHVDTDGIRRGDIVFFDWRGSNRISNIDHVGIVTDVNGRDVLTIEGNTDDRCARRVRRSDSIVGYGRPVYVTTTPEPPASRPQVSLSNLEFDDRHADVGVFQTALKDKGYDPGPIDSWYANQTKDACRRFQLAQGWENSDGIPGPMTVDRLGLALREAPVPDPEPDPEPPPPPPPRPSAVFEEVYPGAPVSESVKVVQRALDEEFGGVVVDGDFGPQTRDAYSRWQRSLGYTGDDASGTPGLTSFTRLAEKYGFEVERGTEPPPPPPPPVDDGEPVHDYRRVSYGGKTVNVRTREMLKDAVEHLSEHYSWTPYLTQGSYNRGVSASAGTHDGGGVIDIRTSTMSTRGQEQCVQALRKAGFAAWLRVPPAFSTHIHAVAIGDREMSSAAKSQIRQWAVDTNGLANHGPDPAPDPYPSWTQKYR